MPPTQPLPPTCPHIRAYVDTDRTPPAIARCTCTNCGHVWLVVTQPRAGA